MTSKEYCERMVRLNNAVDHTAMLYREEIIKGVPRSPNWIRICALFNAAIEAREKLFQEHVAASKSGGKS